MKAARKMRATHTVNVDRVDAVSAVREIMGGKMADCLRGKKGLTIERRDVS